MDSYLDILFADAQLLKHWIAHIGGEGWASKTTLTKTGTTKKTAELTAKILSIESKCQVFKENAETRQIEFLKDAIFIAREIVTKTDFHNRTMTYSMALHKNTEGHRPPRYILIKGYISWMPIEHPSLSTGDIVIVNSLEPTAPPFQHLIQLDINQNVAVSPYGLHCLEASALTFWQDFFQPSTEIQLTSCKAVLIWR